MIIFHGEDVAQISVSEPLKGEGSGAVSGTPYSPSVQLLGACTSPVY